jgi:sulfoxide reductase heme-binding subunit YedZ
MTLLAATAPSPLWYVTRGSGVVTLLLLTLSVCLGVSTSVRWRTGRLPRFVVAALHRNVTLLAVAFLAVHVATTLADSYAPIGVRDAFVPFVSAYRPIWLGLGTLACDLLIAVVLTSLLRVRIGYRVWRLTHWLAYASWPLALVHSLGTGSDARFRWLGALAVGCICAVGLSVLVRIARAPGDVLARGAAGTAAVFVAAAVLVWYGAGPAQHGWAARAGTPTSLLRATRVVVASAPPVRKLPRSFEGRLTGTVREIGPNEGGLVVIRIDAAVRGAVRGQLRLALQGYPSEEGGVSMTSSGVAFAATGSPVFDGSIVGLQGDRVDAQVSTAGGGTVNLTLLLSLDAATGSVTGVVHGERA